MNAEEKAALAEALKTVDKGGGYSLEGGVATLVEEPTAPATPGAQSQEPPVLSAGAEQPS